MRPVSKGVAPRVYQSYQDSIDDLTQVLGWYCSYCEQPIRHVPEVEHIQPKSLHPHLICHWDNFLLACKSCNTAKGNTDVNLALIAFPDTDNTFLGLSYLQDGQIAVSITDPSKKSLIENLVTLVKLHRHPLAASQADLPSPKDRRSHLRIEVWAVAKRALKNYEAALKSYGAKAPIISLLVDSIADLMVAYGFFSVWMAVFVNHPTILNLIVAKFVGTHSGCFDQNGIAVSHPVGRF